MVFQIEHLLHLADVPNFELSKINYVCISIPIDAGSLEKYRDFEEYFYHYVVQQKLITLEQLKFIFELPENMV